MPADDLVREQFEAWATLVIRLESELNGGSPETADDYAAFMTRRRPNGEYMGDWLNEDWPVWAAAWQAREVEVQQLRQDLADARAAIDRAEGETNE